MSRPRSLRTKLIIGALVWTLTMTAIVHFVTITVVRHVAQPMSVVHFAFMTIVAVGLLLAALALVRSGLSPLQVLRERLAELRAGRTRRLQGEYPAEVQPLVEDLNAMLEERERRIARAQAKAGDLAHGLKTPLALLAHEADQLRAAGHREAAAALDEQIGRMRGQIDYHLAQARAAVSGASPDVRCDLRDCAQSLARTLRKLHAERAITIAVDIAPEHAPRVERADADEMLGNLLDNACRWAASRVEIISAREGDTVVITIDDDGPGLAPELRTAVLQRGVRADEGAPGSGLGLAIVRDVAELYSGTIRLESSPRGGLRALLRLPA